MEQDLRDISDGKLYSNNDMVRLGCRDCEGCSACCEDMGQSVLLDPYDIWQLTNGLGMTFEELLGGPVELHLEEGLVYPNLRMVQSADESETRPISPAERNSVALGDAMQESLPHCYFLNAQGRCNIHDFRPGICRLFPLGRNYEPEKLEYFLLTDACPKASTKVKIQKWMGVAKIRDYEAYLVRWHNITKQVRSEILGELQTEGGEERSRQQSMEFLQYFYMMPYKSQDFFAEWGKRVDAWEQAQ